MVLLMVMGGIDAEKKATKYFPRVFNPPLLLSMGGKGRHVEVYSFLSP